MFGHATLARQRTFGVITVGALLGVALAITAPARASNIESGNVASEARAVSGFQVIALRGPIDLVVRQGSREAVQVRADDNLLPLVQTVVEGPGNARTLRIQFKPGESVYNKTPVVVTIDVTTLTAVSSASSGSIAVEPLKTLVSALSISGSSSARSRQLDTEQLSISIAGSGDTHVAAQKTIRASIAGSGEVEYSGSAVLAKSRIAGSGSARQRQH